MTELKDELETVCGMLSHVMHVQFICTYDEREKYCFCHLYDNNRDIVFVESVFCDEDHSIYGCY